ncbi:MAG TPA: hemolysin family protein [Candidatus Dormibacteraeota bacterium]
MAMSGYLVLLVVAMLVATFAAAAETSLNSASKLRMRSRAEAGDRRAVVVARMQANPNAPLSTILTLNTVAVIVASTAAVLYAAEQLPDVNHFIVDLVLSILVLVLCEIAPKSMALRYSERVALGLGPVVRALTVGLGPVVGGLTFLGTLPLRALGQAREVRGPFVTEQDLKMLVTVGEQQGVVDEEEREMIHGVLELTDKVVRELMVPRVDIAGVEAAGSVDDVIALVNATGHSRIPIYETTIDNVVGVVYAKDLLRPREPGATLRQVARAPSFVPESKRAGELLHELQVKKVHIAIVVDEYGGTAGLVTMEDLTEEIIGEIRDEYDIAEQEEVQFLSDTEALVTARLSIEDAVELLHLAVDPEELESDSIGGLIYERLGEIPNPGAVVELGDTTLTVESVRRNSIQTVRISSPRPFAVERNGVTQRDDRAFDAVEKATPGTREGAAGAESPPPPTARPAEPSVDKPRAT